MVMSVLLAGLGARITSRRDLRNDPLLEDIVSEKRCCCSCLTPLVYYIAVMYS